MNRNEAMAITVYLHRANGIVPATGAEWSLISGAIKTIGGVANGIIDVEIKPARPDEVADPAEGE